MDGELGAALENILSDPAQLEKLSHMARELFGQGSAPDGGGQEAAGGSAPADVPGTGTPEPDARFIAALGKAFSGNVGKSRSTALLMAMRPYMKPEKQEKLDRAVQVARMVNVARVVMGQYGGDGHGG